MKSILFALAIVMAILTGPAHTRAQDADTPVSSDNPLAGTTWQLVSLGVAPVVEGSIITLGFNPDGSSGGNAGCNGYGAGYTLDGDALTFESPMSTMMYCEPEALMTQEIAYLAALASVTRYTLDGDALLLEGDQTLLSFER
ncbi:MAG: META domain-containing protein, partial [Anaerolineae bacterium]|nr:META domain-containing protein [Anaerolineae bacterium]